MSPSQHVYSCFRPSGDDQRYPPSTPPPPATLVADLNSTVCLYQTQIGLFTLSWSRNFFGHLLDLRFTSSDHCLRSPFSFDLQVKPLSLLRKHGCKGVNVSDHKVQIIWDLSRAKFGSGPEPRSGFFVAVLVDGEVGLMAGDRAAEGYAKTRRGKQRIHQALVLRKQHVIGNKVFGAEARFGGKTREISIDCRMDEDPKLCFRVDGRTVVQIKRLKWKFRGNEKVEIDGTEIQFSWDVYSWLFQNNGASHHRSKKKSRDGPAVFMFRFETEDKDDQEQKGNKDDGEEEEGGHKRSAAMRRIEWRKMRTSFFKGGRSSSFSSISNFSSTSSACSSSVMEWASSADEGELSSGDSHGFSLVLYAWRK